MTMTIPEIKGALDDFYQRLCEQFQANRVSREEILSIALDIASVNDRIDGATND